MKHIHLDKIKSLESPPKKVNIFSEKEIKMIQELYKDLPESTFNKKQNIRKKSWLQNYNKELDQIYFSKLKDILGDFKMDSLKSESGEDYYGLFHESFSPLPLHVDSGFDEIGSYKLTNLYEYDESGSTSIRDIMWWNLGFGFNINNFKFTWNTKYLGNEYIKFSDLDYMHDIGSISYFQVDWKFLD